MSDARRAETAKTSAWTRFEEAAREALAAGNEYSLLKSTLDTQHKAVEDARDLLWVRDA